MDFFAKSSLGRPLDPAYKTNVAIMVLTLLAGVVLGGVSLFQSGDVLSAIGVGLLYGAIVFVAWVITREIDPDHDLSAFVSVALAFSAALLLMPDTIALWPMALIILITRILSRVVGIAATIIDSLVVIVVMGLAAYTGDVAVALVATLVFFLDALLENPQRRQWGFGILAVVAVIIVSLIFGQGVAFAELSTPYLLTIAVISLAFVLTVVATRHITTHSDFGDRPLALGRVRAAMLMSLAIGLAHAFTNGNGGVLSMIPLWASLAAVPLYRLMMRIGIIGE